MIRMKVKVEPSPEINKLQLPEPMPATLEDAKKELALCEERGDWARAAALKYAAIPWLEVHELVEPGWQDVPQPESHLQPSTPREPFPWRLVVSGSIGTIVFALWIFLGMAVGSLSPSHCFIAGFFAVPFLAADPLGWLIIAAGIINLLGHGCG